MIPGFSWIRIAIYAAVLAAVVAAWFVWLGAHDTKVATAATQAERNQWLERDAKAAQVAATETQRRLDAQKESNREARKFIEQAAAAAAGDRSSRERVHNDLATATATRRSNPAAVAQCAPAESDVDLYAQLSRRADEAAGELAEAAEAFRGAGEQCQRDYEALNPKP